MCKLSDVNPARLKFMTSLQYITLSSSLKSYSYSSLEASELFEKREWVLNNSVSWVMASVWPAALIQNLAWDLCTNLSIRGCRLPARIFLFFFLSIIQVRLVIFSLAAEFKKGPSGVMSKKRGTLLQLPAQLITYSALTVSNAAQFSFPNWLCFVEVKKFAHLDAPQKCGRISNPTLPLPYQRTHLFFFLLAVSFGDM